MPTAENNHQYHGQDLLATLAGWSPKYRSLEAEAAARVTFHRRGAK